MPRTETRLTASEKKAWMAFCKENNLSEATILRKMIMRVTEGQVPIKSLEYKPAAKTNQIKIRLNDAGLAALDAKASKEGYCNRTGWTTAVVLAALHREPVLTDDEVATLRESNRELAAIGRNLNQVARALNIDFRESDKLKQEDIEKLAERIEQHKGQVAALLSRNMNRWDADDAE